MNNPMRNLPRRSFLTLVGGGIGALMFAPSAVLAFSVDRAEALIENVIADIMSIINSGKSEAAMLKDFEGIFSDYGDVEIIGQLVLGADGRSASASQKRAFANAFQIYISHKYGRRFREMAGGRVEITDARAVKSFYEVSTKSIFVGQAPFEVVYVVSDKSGRFIDLKIEGISLIKSERSEIGTMLDRRGGDLDRLIADLKNM